MKPLEMLTKVTPSAANVSRNDGAAKSKQPRLDLESISKSVTKQTDGQDCW